MKKNSVTKNMFDKFDATYYMTDGYDNYLTRFEEEGNDVVSRLMKAIIPDSRWSFLDVGCGMGGTIVTLRKMGFNAWGTEVSEYCLEHSPVRKWIKNASATKLTFEEGSFDVVICMDVFCYLDRTQALQACRELIRVAKHYLYIESVCKGSPNSDQKLNPDVLRKDKELFTKLEMRRMFENNDALFVEALYKEEESPDFNAIFVK